jgi:D-3-phosphoglycerate dehydrogenase / 2-oxoglutarate reductase
MLDFDTSPLADPVDLPSESDIMVDHRCEVTLNDSARRILFSQRFLDDGTRALVIGSGFRLEEAPLKLGQTDADLTADEMAALLDGIEGWIVGHVRIDRALLERIPSVKIIARRGVGSEKIDLKAAAALGKVVTIARGGNEETVADHTVGLMLSLGRRIAESHEAMKAGRWSILAGTDLYQKTVGLVGFGPIARAVARRVCGFEVTVLANSPSRNWGMEDGVEFVTLETLLERSDYISLHTPQNASTQGLIGPSAFSRMKPGAILINTARASVLDETALLDALRSGRLKGAGLDVLAAESDPAQRSLADELLKLPNVVITPHAAASTQESLVRTNRIAAQCVIDVLEGRSPRRECFAADGRV